MIESPISTPKLDRLAAFVEAFKLRVTVVSSSAAPSGPTLFVTAATDGTPVRVVFSTRGGQGSLHGVLVAATVAFDNTTNPLMNAMPDELVIQLDEVPALRDTTAAFVAEALGNRCGRIAALNRLAEVIVLMILRRAIDLGATGQGLLAALAHPALHRALVSMHEMPSRSWRVDDLAALVGMSRSHFMSLFHEVVGTTPMAYLTTWRLTLARRYLLSGETVKSVARRIGFGSASAFSRAFSRQYGYPPTTVDASVHLN